MGVSSDGQICYGIAFEEDYEFPWLDEKWSDDKEEDWWITDICGYKPPFEICNEHGEYFDGIRPTQEKINQYFKHYQAFKEENPMHVEIVKHCSDNYTMYIIAVPGTFQWNSRGDVEEIKMRVIKPDEEKNVIDFCEKYCKPNDEYYKFPEMKLRWLLTSMYR